MMTAVHRRAYLGTGLLMAAVLTFVITVWTTIEFDVALVCYGGATLYALAALVWRFLVWAQRPATRVYLVKGGKDLVKPRVVLGMAKRVVMYFGAQSFVAKRGKKRWAAHFPIAVGCMMAFAIVFPLVFGWVYFQTPVIDGVAHFDKYQIMLFGIGTQIVPVNSLQAFMLFHGLVWASIPVVVGCLVALRRRLADRGDAATQTFADDFLPLLLILSMAVTGLMLTASYSWLAGEAYDVMAWLHAVTVVAFLLHSPFGKLLHVPQRLVKLTQMAYETAAEAEPKATCARCGASFAPARQIADLKRIEKELGFSYEMSGNAKADHYQDICPKCRRHLLVTAQSTRWATARKEAVQ